MTDVLSSLLARKGDAPTFESRTWESILGQARRSALLPRIADHFIQKEWIDNTPTGPRLHITSSLRLVDRQRHEVLWEAERIRRALVDLQMPVVVLKGAAYLLAGLPPSRGRLFSDIDLMVPQGRIAEAEEALMLAGWLSEERDAYNQRYYRQWMHEVPPMRHLGRLSVIDLHHTITPPTSRYSVDGTALLERIVPLANYSGMFVLAPEDMVLHSAVHLFLEGEFDRGLRDLLDIRDLLQHFERQHSGFWDRLIRRAEELHLQQPLLHCLHHITLLLDFRPPDAAATTIQAWERNTVGAKLLRWCLTLALRPNHPSCDSHYTGLARWLLYVRSHFIRMPIHLLVVHLVRKAWMRRFPPDTPKEVEIGRA